MITVTELSSDDVFSVVEEVWTTFLDAERPIFPTPRPTSEQAPSTHPEWTAAVSVTGAWEAAIMVSMSDLLAAEVTERMLGLDAADGQPATADVTDALGELVNIIGGNVKSLMPGPGKLSLPLVAQGPIGSSSRLMEACRLDLGWAGHQLRVVVQVPTQSTGTADSEGWS